MLQVCSVISLEVYSVCLKSDSQKEHCPGFVSQSQLLLSVRGGDERKWGSADITKSLIHSTLHKYFSTMTLWHLVLTHISFSSAIIFTWRSKKLNVKKSQSLLPSWQRKSGIIQVRGDGLPSSKSFRLTDSLLSTSPRMNSWSISCWWSENHPINSSGKLSDSRLFAFTEIFNHRKYHVTVKSVQP